MCAMYDNDVLLNKQYWKIYYMEKIQYEKAENGATTQCKFKIVTEWREKWNQNENSSDQNTGDKKAEIVLAFTEYAAELKIA